MYPVPITQPEIVKQEFNHKEFDGVINLDCIRVVIEGDEYLACEQAALNFWAKEKGGHYGKGAINTEEDETKCERVGLLGQMAFSKLTDDVVDLEYKKGGDKYDNIIFGKYKVDVKCAHKKGDENLIQKKTEKGYEMKIDKDIYVGAFLDPEENCFKKMAVVILVGFCFKKEVLSSKVKKSPIGNWYNYVMHFGDMRPICGFIETLNKFKETARQQKSARSSLQKV